MQNRENVETIIEKEFENQTKYVIYSMWFKIISWTDLGLYAWKPDEVENLERLLYQRWFLRSRLLVIDVLRALSQR